MKNNYVRNEAQWVGIGAIVVAFAVLGIFWLFNKSGIGTNPDAPAGAMRTSTMQSPVQAPSPSAT